MRTFVGFLFLLPMLAMGAIDRRGFGPDKDCADMDLVFVLDESTSITSEHFKKQLDFVNTVIDYFTVGREKVHIGVETFASRVRTILHLGDYSDKQTIQNKVGHIQQATGNTYTYDALEHLAANILNSNRARPLVPHVAVVITDGNSQDPRRTKEKAKMVHDSGITVLAIGVGDVKTSELENIASDPSYVYRVDNYDVIDKLDQILPSKVCQVVTTPAPMIEDCSSVYPMDVLFAISDQADRDETAISLNFIKRVARNFTIGSNDVQVGLTPRFGEDLDEIRLRDHDTMSGLESALDRRQLEGLHADGHLRYMYTRGFARPNGGRLDSAQFGILIIDSESLFPEKVNQLAAGVREDGVELVVIGVGPNVNQNDLQLIVSDPAHLKLIDSYDELPDEVDFVIDVLCKKIMALRRSDHREWIW